MTDPMGKLIRDLFGDLTKEQNDALKVEVEQLSPKVDEIEKALTDILEKYHKDPNTDIVSVLTALVPILSRHLVLAVFCKIHGSDIFRMDDADLQKKFPDFGNNVIACGTFLMPFIIRAMRACEQYQIVQTDPILSKILNELRERIRKQDSKTEYLNKDDHRSRRSSR